MGYEVFESLCKKLGVKPYQVSQKTGISTATLSSWKKGTYTPKADKMQKLADYFGVSVDYFTTGEDRPEYYVNPETAKIAQEVFEDENLRALFSAARSAKPEDIKLATDMLMRFKETNSDG